MTYINIDSKNIQIISRQFLIEGSFDRKTTVAILDEKLVEIGKGVTDFSSEELQQNLELHNSVMVINRNRMRINDNYSRGKT